MEERRQHIRISEVLAVNYRILRRLIAFTSRSEDISVAGMRLATAHRLETEMVLGLNFSLFERTEPLVVDAKVVWQKEVQDVRAPFVVGVKFININPVVSNALASFIQEKFAERKSMNMG